MNPLAHVRNRFTFTIQAPLADVAPLFGAHGERAWAEGWEPRFLHPDPPRDEAGAVFTVAREGYESTWITTIFEPERGRIQHVYFIAGVMVTLIDIHLSEHRVEREHGRVVTSVEVTYERTALSPDASARVIAMGSDDAGSGESWRAAIEKWLAGAT